MFSLVEHYRRLANEAGERAQQATDPSLKSTFAELAKGYVRWSWPSKSRRKEGAATA